MLLQIRYHCTDSLSCPIFAVSWERCRQALSCAWLTLVLVISGCGSGDDDGDAPASGPESAGPSISASGLVETEDLPFPEKMEDEEGFADSGAPRFAAEGGNSAPPPRDNTDEPPEPPLLPSYRDQVRDELESSLLGDSDHAVNVSMVITRCRGKTLDEQRIIRQLERAQLNEVKPGTRWTFANGMSVVYENYEQYESFLWRQHDQCQSVKGLFGNELRERIEELADQGNPQARYLYAMWPPERALFSSKSTLETLDYHNRALDYTWANLDEGEWLGVMAMGQSYSGSGRGLFTPSDHSLGRVFLMAAERCGLENDWLSQHNEEIRTRLRPTASNHLLTQYDKDAAGLAELFCR